jgi:hypothetical protein
MARIFRPLTDDMGCLEDVGSRWSRRQWSRSRWPSTAQTVALISQPINSRRWPTSSLAQSVDVTDDDCLLFRELIDPAAVVRPVTV